mgnify:CR=1 FL=1
MRLKSKFLLRISLLILFSLLIALGLGQYGLLVSLTRFMCPSCVGIG